MIFWIIRLVNGTQSFTINREAANRKGISAGKSAADPRCVLSTQSDFEFVLPKPSKGAPKSDRRGFCLVVWLRSEIPRSIYACLDVQSTVKGDIDSVYQ